jgi:hypothetical protein
MSDAQTSNATAAITRPTTNGMAIAGFVLAFFFSPLGLVFSILALSQIAARPTEAGRGLAIAGVIISLATMAIAIIAWVMFFVYASDW